ncbi:MAG: hypothetical protein JO356_18225 [Acidobacteria bacterium]|nr:hypothetical protein [Acidobacteriota bacterium]
MRARGNVLPVNGMDDKVVGGPVQVMSSPSPALIAKESRSVSLDQGKVTTSLRREITPLPAGAPLYEWTLSAEGAVLRSSDQGKTWQSVPSARGGPFAALSSVGTHVWIGGKAGALYHSADSGETWHQLTPAVPDRSMSFDITHIEFSDPMSGVVRSADGESWRTADGGLSWSHD